MSHPAGSYCGVPGCECGGVPLPERDVLTRNVVALNDNGEVWLLLPHGGVELWWTAGVIDGVQHYQLRHVVHVYPKSGLLRRGRRSDP